MMQGRWLRNRGLCSWMRIEQCGSTKHEDIIAVEERLKNLVRSSHKLDCHQHELPSSVSAMLPFEDTTHRGNDPLLSLPT